MRENILKSKWQRGELIINGWLAIPSPWSAELMAHQDWDSLTVDMQHGLIDYETALQMLIAISTTPVMPLVRVPWNEPGILQKMLDAGAYGLICPMINTAAEAEALVTACRYPPLGTRSYGPTRALYYGGADYLQKANETIMVLAMIETAQALQNLEAILDVPGLDGVYIGPSDLGISLGVGPTHDFGDPRLIQPIERIIASAHQHQRLVGVQVMNADAGKLMVSKGVDLVTPATDGRLLAAAASAVVTAMRG